MSLIETKDKECHKCKGRMIKLWTQTGGYHCEVGGTSRDMFNVAIDCSWYKTKDIGISGV